MKWQIQLNLVLKNYCFLLTNTLKFLQILSMVCNKAVFIMNNDKETLKDILEKASSILGLNDFYSRDMQYWEDENKNILSISTACEKITGYTTKEFINNPKLIENIIYTDDRKIWQDRCKDVHLNDVDRIEFRINHKSGKTVWLEHDSQKLYNAKGIFIGLRSSNRDITRRKYTEEIIYSSSSVLFLWKNEEGHPVEFVSPNVETVFGYTIEEFISGRVSYNDIIHPECVKRVKSEVVSNIKMKEENFNHKPYRIITKDKRTIWVSDSTTIRINSNNEITNFYGIVTDITKQKKAEKALKSSEKRYKSLVESSPNGIVIHSEGRIMYANAMAVKLIGGKSSKNFLKKEINDFIHPDFLEEIRERLKNITDGLRTRAFFEMKFNCLDGTTIDVAVASANIKHKGKIAIQTVFYDITKAKKAQVDLRKSEEIYRNVFNYSPLGILHFDKDGKITDCNEEFASIIGSTREMLTGFNMLLQLNDKGLKKAVQKSLTSGSGYYKSNYISVTAGRTSQAIGRFNAIYSDKKEIIGGVGLIEDIAARLNHEKLQKALFDISETASKTISVNELYKELHAIIQNLMPANNIFVAIHNTEKNSINFPFFIDEKDKKIKKQAFGRGLLTEYILIRKKSQIITPQMEAELVRSGVVNYIGTSAAIWVGIYLKFEGNYKGVLVLQDYNNPNAYDEDDVKILEFVSAQIVKVLDKKYADERLISSIKELSEAKQELEIINENKDRFFSIIAHDLRSPFNTLLGVSEIISGNMDDMSMREIKEISSVIYSSTQNLFKLIENLLSWSRLQMGAFIVEPIQLEINNVAKSVLEILEITAKDKEITIINNLDELKVFADEECVKTVLRNLISNAIKFTKRYGKVELSSKSNKKFVEITIGDSGVGMKPEILEEIFSINKKTSTTGTENESGTGLGLILCKDLVEKNNGKIWAISEYGKGSKFIFTLQKKE